MSTSSTYRADHVGSFLRPADLLQARKCGIPSDELRALEDRHVKRVLEKQQELGLARVYQPKTDRMLGSRSSRGCKSPQIV
jgi:5-methyltetrahydropteroyltriglutamate--homocysteine methyltransferase